MDHTSTSVATAASDARMAGRVAIVTGAGTGIGRAAATRFAAEGAKVVLAGRRRAELESTAHQISEAGGAALVVPTDVSVEAEVAALIASTLDRFGRLDAAFNNAGIEGVFGPITELTESDFDQVVRVNLKGAWLSIKHQMIAMIASGQGGSIVNTSSFVAKNALAGASAYAASKGGLDAMVAGLAVEGGPHGVRINNVLPGAIDTPMFARLDGAAAAAAVTRQTPLGRLGQPSDVGDVAVWLASDEARFVTGQTLLVDGGLNLPGAR